MELHNRKLHEKGRISFSLEFEDRIYCHLEGSVVWSSVPNWNILLLGRENVGMSQDSGL